MFKVATTLPVFSADAIRQSIWLSVAEGIFTALPWLLFIPIIEQLLQPEPDMEFVLALICFNPPILVLRIWLTRQTMLQSGMMTYNGCASLREQLARHFFRVPMGFFQRHDPGQLSQSMNKDVEFTETIFSHFFAQFIAALAALITLSTALLWYDWRLTLTLLCGLPLAVISQRWLQTHGSHASATFLKTLGDSNQAIMDWVAGIRDTRLSGRDSQALASMKARLDATRDQTLHHEMIVGLAPMLFTLLSETGFIVFLLVSIELYGSGDISLAVLLVFLVASTRLYRSLAQLAITMAESRFMNQASDRLSALLHSEPLTTSGENHCPGTTVQVKGLSFIYPGSETAAATRATTPALGDISFTAHAGQLTVIVGASGSGKSTLLHLLARYWNLQQGSIHIGEQPLSSSSDQALYRQLALVSQDIWLLDDSIINNLRLARDGLSDSEIEQVCRRTRCHDFISQLPEGYHSQVGEGGSALSGGERQRLALARALLINAPILLLDEISSALDVQNEQAILTLLLQLRHNHTLIMIAHRETLAASADQVLFLQQGQLVAQGSHQQLLGQSQDYRRLWGRA